ncbi:28S ribosomal protein S6, mitochondrial [Lates japonicus]|uniref:Small ribosomal subunit protein bS6m n=1 Tax=Lates japonicus TaxID=270547 RepID=A0AAD3NBQ4_LATJO|nr:28S ribosomal protein S6, mitochondrial [Lates japonicus]
MPRYELALILKAMQRPETAATLRRTVETLMERGAVVRDLENLGERLLPYKITKHNERHSRGAYFLQLLWPPTVTECFHNSCPDDVQRDASVFDLSIVVGLHLDVMS